MAYDEQLADRIRELVGVEPGLFEQPMFGGLAFLIDGHMSVVASRRGGLMVRVDPSGSADLVNRPGVELIVMGGRPMTGWLYVDVGEVVTKRRLATWVGRGVAYARSLPPKPPKARRSGS